MKAFALLGCLACSCSTFIRANETADFRAAVSALQTANALKQDDQIGAAYGNVITAWQRLTHAQQESEWPQLALAHVGCAESELAKAKAAEAANSLRKAANLNRQFGGRIEYSTKSSHSFFSRLAKLQAGITHASGIDPLAGLVDYLFRKSDGQFIVARTEDTAEANGITIPGVLDAETLVQAHEIAFTKDGGVKDKIRWLICPKGAISDSYDQATREVSFNSDGKLVIAPLTREAPGAKSTDKATARNAQAHPQPETAATQGRSESSNAEFDSKLWIWGGGAVIIAAIAFVWRWLRVQR